MTKPQLQESDYVAALEAEIRWLRHGLTLIVSESGHFPAEDGIGAGTMARNTLAGAEKMVRKVLDG